MREERGLVCESQQTPGQPDAPELCLSCDMSSLPVLTEPEFGLRCRGKCCESPFSGARSKIQGERTTFRCSVSKTWSCALLTMLFPNMNVPLACHLRCKSWCVYEIWVVAAREGERKASFVCVYVLVTRELCEAQWDLPTACVAFPVCAPPPPADLCCARPPVTNPAPTQQS